MRAQTTIKVHPPALLQAAASAATTAAAAAAPDPGTVPVAAPGGSAADDAAALIAAGISAREAALAAKLAGKGPLIQATTQAGVAELQGQDEQNGAQIRAVGQQAVTV